jgi:hypothetical protein
MDTIAFEYIMKWHIRRILSMPAAAVWYGRNWSSIHEKKHVVIHLPSLGLTEGQRQGLSKPHLRENSQMARLCDLADPLVEVVYVAPFNLPQVSPFSPFSPFTKDCKRPLRQICEGKDAAVRV